MIDNWVGMVKRSFACGFLPRIIWILLCGRCAWFFLSLMHRFFNVLCGRFACFLPQMHELFLRFALRLGLPQMHRFFNVLCGRFAWCFPRLSTFDFIMWSLCLVFLSRMHELFLGFCASLGFATDAQIF